MIMQRILLDTNVLVYLYDHNSPEKQVRARTIIDLLVNQKNGSISAQNLSEFISVTLRRLNPRFSPAEALEEANLLAGSLQVLDLTRSIILEAVRGVRDHKLSYYDAQVWAAARLNQIPLVLSEDFQDGQTIEDVHFVNPFSNTFTLERWI
jgi:predicted nucleic acid-binding protein